jgi:uncharacterized cupin superfamily protein
MIAAAREMSFEDFTPSAAIQPAWVVAGTPDEANHLLHASPDGQFIVQVWECRSPVELELRDYPCDEFMTLIEGKVEVTEEDGTVLILAAGDSFFIKKGHNGLWRQSGGLRKYSVCYLG